MDSNIALQAAQAAIQQTEERIAELRHERATKIEQADADEYIADVAKIDAEIVRLQASLSAHHDRIAIIQRRLREQERASREQQKSACIAAVKKAVPRRQAAIERVDDLTKQLAEAVAALEAADALSLPNVARSHAACTSV